MHQKNPHAIRMHFQGAVAVVQKHGSPYNMGRLAQKILASFACWTSFAPPNTLLVPFAELVWSSSLDSSSTEDDASNPDFYSDSLYPSAIKAVSIGSPHSRKSHGKRKNSVGVSTGGTSTDCPPPSRQRHPHETRSLSPALNIAIQRMTALSLLARRARCCSLSYQELVELMAGICCGGQRLASIRPKSLSPLEDSIRMTTLVHFFADVVPYEDGDEPRIAHLTDSVQGKLSFIDHESLLDDWPEALLWISIVVGVFAKGNTWAFFQDLLRLTCGRLKILRWSGINNCINQFQPISSEPFLGFCKAFWLSSRALKAVQIE